jgi:hypothetical protein
MLTVHRLLKTSLQTSSELNIIAIGIPIIQKPPRPFASPSALWSVEKIGYQRQRIRDNFSKILKKPVIRVSRRDCSVVSKLKPGIY